MKYLNYIYYTQLTKWRNSKIRPGRLKANRAPQPCMCETEIYEVQKYTTH